MFALQNPNPNAKSLPMPMAALNLDIQTSIIILHKIQTPQSADIHARRQLRGPCGTIPLDTCCFCGLCRAPCDRGSGEPASKACHFQADDRPRTWVVARNWAPQRRSRNDSCALWRCFRTSIQASWEFASLGSRRGKPCISDSLRFDWALTLPGR